MNKAKPRVVYADPLEELEAIRLVYGLSYEDLAMEMKSHTGLVSTSLYRILKIKKAKRPILKTIRNWLAQRGRRKFPLYMKGE